MVAADIAGAWRRGQQGWPSRFVLVQVPNAPLIVALVAPIVAGQIDGRAGDYLNATGQVAFAAFGYLELTDGANWFRRLLGVYVLVTLVIRLAQ